MSIDAAQNNFRRGVTALVILGLLKREDMYGYQLVLQTKELSGGRIVTQEGCLYPILYKMLDSGYISDYTVQVGKRMKRIYYHLEPAGEERLKQLMEEYNETMRGIYQIMGEEVK